MRSTIAGLCVLLVTLGAAAWIGDAACAETPYYHVERAVFRASGSNRGLAVDAGRFWVGEFGGWVRAYARDGSRQTQRDLGGGTIKYLGHGVAVCDGMIATGAWDAVALLPNDGRPMRRVKPAVPGNPCAVASAGKTLWVMNYRSPVLYEMDLDGRLLRRFTTAQHASDTSQDIAIDCRGHLYVLAGIGEHGKTLLEYSPDGRLVRTHRLAVPATAVAIDPADRERKLYTLAFHADPVVYEYLLRPGEPREGRLPNLAKPLRYRPERGEIVIHNGQNRFNRPLYGTNTAFFVYAGDLPEILLSLPGKGGTLWLGLVGPRASKWASEAEHVTARYRAGAMQYEIRDPLLGPGRLTIDVLPMAESEGALVRVAASADTSAVELVWAFGGASGFNRWNLDTCAYCPESACWLRPEDCQGNQFKLTPSGFELRAPCHKSRPLAGTVPPGSQCKIADADKLASPESLLGSTGQKRPILAGRRTVKPGESLDFALHWLGEREKPLAPDDVAAALVAAESRRTRVAQRVRVHTPDPFVNAAVPAICSAADGIWDPPVYVHGGVAWHAPYLGWRGAYVASSFGWHERARTHFRAFAQVQLKEPATARPHADPARNLARQAPDSVLYTRGYIPVHPTKDARGPYDMQQVYIDQLLWHFLWTGDLEFAREMWPTLVDHLDWEKRCFDPDDDGLYENFANTFISDAHHYSGGGCAQASAYNYRAFAMAARLARLLGNDPQPFAREAEKIRAAMQRVLWMPESGWYAEYRDLLGLKRLHPSAELASVYHPIDSDVPELLQAYQMLRYVDTQFERVPVDGPSAVLWSSNWVPYIWSIRNICGVEVAHTALAYWQAGQREGAFRLWRGAIVDAMYGCRAPGACIATSERDARATGLCTDFADTVGMFGRSLVEGLFGIVPDALAGELLLRPGLPRPWEDASLDTPDVGYSYVRQGKEETYAIRAKLARPMRLRLLAPAWGVQVAELTVNGRPAQWACAAAVGQPRIEITAPTADGARVHIRWAGPEPARPQFPHSPLPLAGERPEVRAGSGGTESTPDGRVVVGAGEPFTVSTGGAAPSELADPQKALADAVLQPSGLRAKAAVRLGHRTAFLRVKQGDFTWWIPVEWETRPALEICDGRLDRQQGQVRFSLRNNSAQAISGQAAATCGAARASVAIDIAPGSKSPLFCVPAKDLVPGTNPIRLELSDGRSVTGSLVDWQSRQPPMPGTLDCLDLGAAMNDRVSRIFEHEYRSPRSPYCSLQIPLHGFGDWCYCGKQTPKIDDSALRKAAGRAGRFTSPQGIPFATPGPGDARNVIFVSLWDNFPDTFSVKLSGRARHAWFLVAGSTHPMHSQLDNGEILVAYADGSAQRLALHNPTTWWPIEADYQMSIDGPCIPGVPPPRIDLGSGRATIVDLPLDPKRELRSLTVRCLANEVVVGLMSATLLRP